MTSVLSVSTFCNILMCISDTCKSYMFKFAISYFSWLWRLSWSFKLPNVENYLPQYLHGYGFSPVCFLIWTLKLVFSENCLSQYWQMRESENSCPCLRWRSSCPYFLKVLKHPSWVHLKLHSKCNYWCIFKCCLSLKLLSQLGKSHTKDLIST